jgi:purine-binding chemotaxis protein CheW
VNELHVVFAVGETEYVVAAADVVMMESWQGATRVPGAPPWVAGLVQMRGEVVPVIDLRARFGLDALEPTLDTRIVVVRTGERTVGLKVDRAREVIQLDRAQMGAPPEDVSRASKRFVRAVTQSGTRLLMMIDSSRVVGEETGDGQQRAE